MSAVQDYLKSQMADFISLHDLLEAMIKQEDGCTLQQAAAALVQILKEEADNAPYAAAVPQWASYTPVNGMRMHGLSLRGRLSGPERLLIDLAAGGEYKHEEMADDIPF